MQNECSLCEAYVTPKEDDLWTGKSGERKRTNGNENWRWLPLVGTLQERVHKYQARQQEILTEVAGLRRQREFPLAQLGKKQVITFCSALKEKLQDQDSNFGKEYLKLLVEEIRVDKKEVRLSGSYAALAGALSMSTKPRQLPRAPSFVPVWLPNPDSNQGQGG